MKTVVYTFESPATLAVAKRLADSGRVSAVIFQRPMTWGGKLALVRRRIVRHGIFRVADDIEEHLLQTIRAHIHLRQIWLQHDAEGDVLTLQSRVAQAIATEIRIKLTPAEQAQLERTGPINPEAHEDYLRGRYYWNRRSKEGLVQDIDLKRAGRVLQLVALDPVRTPL